MKINYWIIYIIYLAGEEISPQWVDDYLKNIKQTDALEKIVKRVLIRSNKKLRTILSKIKLDTKEIIQKGNNGFRTKLVYDLAYGLCNDTNYIEDNNISINIKI